MVWVPGYEQKKDLLAQRDNGKVMYGCIRPEWISSILYIET